MLVIRVASFKGRPIGQEMVGRFGETGGTIGRGPNNTLVLPDPERYISRTHVSVSYQAGGFVLTDNGAKNPVMLNGRPLGPGTQARLADGDHIQIGDYELEVALSLPGGARSPIGDPFSVVRPAAERPQFPDVLPREPRTPVSSGAAVDDPFAGLAGREANIDDVYGLKPSWSGQPSPQPPQGGPLERTDKGRVVDPLELFGAPPRSVSGPTVSDHGPELYTPYSPPSAQPDIQRRGDIGSAGLRHDPLSPGAGARSEPWPSTAAPRPDAGAAPQGPPFPAGPGEEHRFGSPPVSPPDPEGPGGRQAPPRPQDPRHDVFRPRAEEPVEAPPAGSWPDLAPQARGGAQAAPPARGSEGLLPAGPDVGPESPPFAPHPRQEPRHGSEPRHDPRSPAAAPVERRDLGAAAPGAADESLLRAFLRGAGLPASRLPGGLTPEAMEMVGKLLREAVQGTLDLLRARTLTKSEMRADMTVIMPVDNNPLKFSPTAEAALAHLLGPPVPGYLPPTRAMKDAYDDLRAHQLGFLAGMRAALDDVLARFEPEQLEERLSGPGMLASLLPMNRKGKLWDLFVEHYTDVVGEAREDFNAAFGKAFLQAYDAQVKRLRTERS